MDGTLIRPEEIDTKELIKLCAVSNKLFNKTFFERTVRQATPQFHDEIDAILDNPANRYINIQVFRGGAKTSKLRMYCAKRIAYGLSHTILIVGKSEGHAMRSVRWLRRQIMYNKLLSGVFNLRPGSKWQDSEAEVVHGVEQDIIWLLAMGIGGSTRGINFDDYRPDLILIDDVIDAENSATPEQRQKITQAIYGDLKEGLAPATETPDAKLAMLQTPLNKEDPSTLALNDPEWVSAKFGCWSTETEDLPLENQKSAWEVRYPTETLRNEKRAAIQRNQLSIFLREKECKLVSPETSAFQEQWLKYYDIPPERMVVIVVIDPVPPPSPNQIAKDFHKKDFEVITVLGLQKGNFFVLEYRMSRGHEPTWTIKNFFELCLKWHPREIYVEAISYQRTLKWILDQEMNRRRQYFVVRELPNEIAQKSKYDKIVDGLNGPASLGHLYCQPGMVEFIEQFRIYPNVNHDDLIETVANGVSVLNSTLTIEGDYEVLDDEDDIKPIKYNRELMAP